MDNIYTKLLCKADLHYPLSGSMQFRNVNWYSLFNKCTGDTVIGDPAEGDGSTTIEYLRIGPPSSEHLRKELNRGGSFALHGDTQVTLSQCFIANRFDAWAMCMVIGEPYEVIPKAIKTSGFDYDACIRIINIDLLIKQIRLAKFAEGRVMDYFAVKYVEMEYNGHKKEIFERTGKLPKYKAKAKDQSYAYQNEARILLTPLERTLLPRPSVIDETFSVVISNPERVIEKFETGLDTERRIENIDPLPLVGKLYDLYRKFNTLCGTNISKGSHYHSQAIAEIGPIYWKLRSIGPSMADIEMDNNIIGISAPIWGRLKFASGFYINRLALINNMNLRVEPTRWPDPNVKS